MGPTLVIKDFVQGLTGHYGARSWTTPTMTSTAKLSDNI